MKVERSKFGPLVVLVGKNKEAIQARILRGVSTTQIASEHGVPASTFRDALDAHEIKYGHMVRSKHDPRVSEVDKNIAIVVARMAKGLGVNYDEIKPYLVNESL